ncbi:50S ribosomal protein L13 [Avrilella dinanensis]|uniref:50S ribosomal protein L13 n=1 Tax=Avrilella dinanensis TaxID=2008672 RepID=UPI002409F321|nr:50S ribosomal protein L13 [Avrilella dinanensis]
MESLSYKTQSLNSQTADKQWVLIDAEGQTLGRLSSEIAKLLRGKHKPGFTPHVDCGDNVVVINAEKITLTGNKLSEKQYIRHTGYPGGQRIVTAEQLQKKAPTQIIEKAVKGMLPKNRLGAQLLKNLNVYAGGEHPHAAQKPQTITFNN